MSKLSNLRELKVDKTFHIINVLFLLSSLLIVSFPILNIIASSLSAPGDIIAGRVSVYPVNFTLDSYRQVLNSDRLIIGYRNSIFYTFSGTLFSLLMTIIAAYPLSRSNFIGRKIITKFFIFTMIFTAPLIPTFLNIRNLGMYDTIWAIIVPGAISIQQMIIARTFFQTGVPNGIVEAAELDGASDIQILVRIVLPLSKAVIAVLVLFTAVDIWNSYFGALIYLNDPNMYPLQLVLRDILGNVAALEQMSDITAEQSQMLAIVEGMKYAIIVVGSLPVIMLYPFIQKYFVKGVMIGSLKE